MFDVVAIGELLIDFAPVNTNEAGYPVLSANPGGAPANYLAALAKYGKRTALMSKVGNDSFGVLLKNTLQNAGIDHSNVICDPDFFTTLAFVSLDENGDRSFSFARKPGADTRLKFDELDLSMIDDCRIFHTGTLSMTDEPCRTAVMKSVEYAKDKGKIVSLDPNLRLPLWNDEAKAREAFLWGLEMADIVKISDDEIGWLWNCSKEEAADKLLNDFGVSLVMITLGPDGCFLANANASCFAPCPKVSPVDTTGCGDIFGGSAASCFLDMGKTPKDLDVKDLEKIARFASTAASLASERHGGIPSIPEMETVLKRMPNA